jgi:hypothetical protein
MYSKADITDSIAVARHACQDAGQLELVGICSGSWYAAQAARGVGARSAILVNPQVWNWRVTPTLLQQWGVRKEALHANTASDTGGDAGESRTKRLRALLNPARKRTKTFMHNHLPRSVLRGLSWVGLVWLPEDVLTTLAHRGTDVTLIASPEDAELFTAKGGRAALDRLRWTSQPPRLIATPTGDHSAHHPAILAAIRNAVLQGLIKLPAERVAVRMNDAGSSNRRSGPDGDLALFGGGGAGGPAGTATQRSPLTAATPGRAHDDAQT